MNFLIEEIDILQVQSIIGKNGNDPEALIAILQDIQHEWGYLPKPALKLVASCLGISEARVWAVATFYDAFTLEPKGRNQIMVCTGTACHVRGAADIVRALEEELKIESGHTTPDGAFSFECAHCLGACAMGPVVVVNGEYLGHMTRKKTLDQIEKIRKGGAA